ncbi:sorting nexin-25-like [Hydractinia symbiolongicarpus]|uniref:sorting nexin-25-like n=1 Tax=Hydractinia symbiolongicarpus TaxID=13093 RepID=UPI00254AECFC|nr:sorting nexin-25-like [Hydractinia symbiolongicarpus]
MPGLQNIVNLCHFLWMKKNNLKLTGPIIIILIAVSYSSGLLQTVVSWILFLLIVFFSIISGLSLVLCRGPHREPPAPLPTLEQQNVTKFMEKITKKYNKHYFQNHLVISKDLDKVVQEVIDLTIRDYCLSWFSDIGKDETAFVEIVNKEVWTIVKNLITRLHNVDNLNFLCNDLILLLYNHFHDLRLSDARKFPGQTTPFLLHPCLKDKDSEIKYLRTCAEVLLFSLLPESNSDCSAMRYILREIVARFVFLATADSVCDPDYINQTLVIYLEDREKITETQKQKYAYAETYEEFIKMINTTTDIDTLKQIRYHTIAEIMQATVIHNSKDVLQQDGTQSNAKQNKKDALRDRNLKRYINQCRVSKSQCEKRIRNLGGPDYRVYGLGHGRFFEGTGNNGKEAFKRERQKSSKILAFGDILENSLARSFFMMYMQRQRSGNLLSFWVATEKLRLMKLPDLQSSADQIFQEYVTPSAAKVIKFESRLVRGMEEFIYGNGSPEYFYEAQKIVYDKMENSFYREFVLSHDYTEFVCASESAMDELRAHRSKEDDPVTLRDWNDGFGFKERRNAEALKAAMPSNIEERNDYAVRTLQALDQNINAKTQALELVQRAQPVDTQEKEALEKEIDRLNTERRHLEFHIERTDLWCEMLGHWKATISNVQYHSENEQPLFVICVSCDDSAENIRDPGATTTGWVVVRELEDFKRLHGKLKECCTWMSKELPVSSKRWYKKQASDSLESLKSSLQEYLTIILGDERLCQSDEVYTFLIPSPEYLRGQSFKSSVQKEKKNPLSFISNIKGSFQNMSFPDILVDAVEADELDTGIDESTQESKDSIAEPMYRLIGEVFELKGVFKILRKTLITFVQITFGGTINRHLREFISWLVSEPMMIYYIDNFKQSMWPKGILAPYPPPRTDLEKLRTREQAKEKMMKSIPDVLANLVGKRNGKLGFMKLFEAIQDLQTNKHLFYVMLELIIVTICPEVKSKEVLASLEKKIGKTTTNITANDIESPTFTPEFNDFGDYQKNKL